MMIIIVALTLTVYNITYLIVVFLSYYDMYGHDKGREVEDLELQMLMQNTMHN